MTNTTTLAPTDAEILNEWDRASSMAEAGKRRLAFGRAVLAKWGAPAPASVARTVMLDQVSFDRKPDCYGIRQITDDESVEEWEDIRTSPDVAREEANDMMATGRGEIYEVVPLWTTPQPSPTPHWQVPAAQGDALSDAVRVPLHSLHADAAYLIGRLRDGSMPYARVIEIIRERIDAASPTAQAAESVPELTVPPAQEAQLNPDMPTQELRLHMGELTADEVLVARAAIRWANTYGITAAQKELPT